MAGAVKVGPWGGSGGTPADAGSASRIQSIQIRHADVVDRVNVYYVTTDGIVFDIIIGGTGGTESKIDLDVDEYLTGISGYVTVYQGITIVGQLSLTTNKGNVYGPYGKGSGTAFSLPIVDGKITNFFGRGGNFVDALGVYMGPN